MKEEQYIKILDELIQQANNIKFENMNILNPKVYKKTRINDKNNLKVIRKILNFKKGEKIDAVMFASPSGAEQHTDIHLKHLETFTYIIPLVLQKGKNELYHSKGKDILNIYKPVKIDHQKPHGLNVEYAGGTVLLMVSKVIRTDFRKFLGVVETVNIIDLNRKKKFSKIITIDILNIPSDNNIIKEIVPNNFNDKDFRSINLINLQRLD